jgi:hypothetical protein
MTKRIPSPNDLRAIGEETMTELVQKIPPARLVEKLERLLEAQVRTRTGELIADGRTQLAAAQVLVAYYVGRPVERQEIVQVNLDADAATGLVERLAKSPALREQVRKALEAADKQ